MRELIKEAVDLVTQVRTVVSKAMYREHVTAQPAPEQGVEQERATLRAPGGLIAPSAPSWAT